MWQSARRKWCQSVRSLATTGRASFCVERHSYLWQEWNVSAAFLASIISLMGKQHGSLEEIVLKVLNLTNEWRQRSWCTLFWSCVKPFSLLQQWWRNTGNNVFSLLHWQINVPLVWRECNGSGWCICNWRVSVHNSQSEEYLLCQVGLINLGPILWIIEKLGFHSLYSGPVWLSW